MELLFDTWVDMITLSFCFYFSCDADPVALAKYVYALVKKDKSLEALREGMIEQLDVFLQAGMDIKFFA